MSQKLFTKFSAGSFCFMFFQEFHMSSIYVSIFLLFHVNLCAQFQVKIQFYLFACAYNFPSSIIEKAELSPLNGQSSISHCKIIDHIIMALFGLSSLLQFCMYSIIPKPSSFNYGNFALTSKIRNCEYCSFMLLKSCLAV